MEIEELQEALDALQPIKAERFILDNIYKCNGMAVVEQAATYCTIDIDDVMSYFSYEV